LNHQNERPILQMFIKPSSSRYIFLKNELGNQLQKNLWLLKVSEIISDG